MKRAKVFLLAIIAVIIVLSFAACNSNSDSKVLTNIEITTQPTKTTYTEGEFFDPAGMVVAAKYSDNSSESVTSYTYKTEALTINDTQIIVSYLKDGTTKTADVSITVNPSETIPPNPQYTEGLEFRLIENYTAYEVTGIGTATDTDINIPAEFNGIPVTSIKASAFDSCFFLTSITIPSSITNIAIYAFDHCSNLKDINVNSNNANYSSLNGILFNKNQTSIICYPAGKAETSYVVPNDVTNIGMSAFRYCVSLKSITLGSGVKSSIVGSAFIGSSELNAINVDSVNTSYSSLNGVLFNKNQTTLVLYPMGKTETTYIIPNSINSISSYGFCYSKIIEITLPSSLTNIGVCAFLNSTSLTTIVISNSVTTIEQHAFNGCSNLTIYTEAPQRLDGWDIDWNSSNRPVIWEQTEPVINAQIPSVFGQPTSGSVTVGTTYNLSVAANVADGGILTYQWYSNTTNNTTGGSAISGATSPSYAVPTGLSGTHYYYVVITNTNSSVNGTNTAMAVSNIAIITIMEPPVHIPIPGESREEAIVLEIDTNTIADVGLTLSSYDGKWGVWYSFTPDTTAEYIIESTISISGNTYVYLFNSLAGSEVDYDDDGGNGNNFKLPYTLNAGTTFYFFVANYSQSNGTITFTLSESLEVFTGNVDIGNFTYYLYRDNTASLRQALDKNMETISIPLKITYGKNEYTIDYIDAGAFEGCSNLKNITLPFVGRSRIATGYESVFGYIFGYTAVKSYSLPTAPSGTTFQYDGVSGYNYYYYFYNIPSSLKTVILTGEEVTAGAFNNCTGLTSVVLADSVISINNSAFYNCTSLTNITLPNGLTSIGNSAFYGCSNLNGDFIIPIGVTTINSNTFYGCNRLASITIHSAVAIIGSNAFYDCANLSIIWYYNPSLTAINIRDCLTTVIVSNDVTRIGNNAFSGCPRLETVLLSSSVINIGLAAFSYCTGLTSITIPSSVMNIEGNSINDGAFRNCSRLANVVFESGSRLTHIGTGAFNNCKELTDITFPASLTKIGWQAFYECNSLKNIDFEDMSQLSLIEGYAFSYCTALENVLIPSSVCIIWQGAFSNCTMLSNVYFNAVNADIMWYPGSFESIFANAGKNCAGTIITIGASVTKIPDNMYAPSNIINVFFEERSQCLSIGDYAFYNCNKLKDITIPTLVTNIGDYAFSGCGLTSIVLQPSLSNIGDYAFYSCNDLTNIIFANQGNLTNIGGGAFGYCRSLTGVAIPNSVKNIGGLAFYECRELINVIIPNSVAIIGSGAFAYCLSLTVYAEAMSKPSGWDSGWNVYMSYWTVPVVWGCTWAKDVYSPSKILLSGELSLLDSEFIAAFNGDVINDKLAYQSAVLSLAAYNIVDTIGYSSQFRDEFTQIRTYDFGETVKVICGQKILTGGQRVIAIAFEGTSVNANWNWKIWESDGGLTVTGWEDLIADIYAFPVDWSGRGNIHSGFLAWYSVFLVELFPNIITDYSINFETDLFWVTGHSLGGALAELLTVDLIVLTHVDPIRIICYTFGAPPVGSTELKSYAQEKGVSPRIYRIVNANDPVPNFGINAYSMASRGYYFVGISGGFMGFSGHSIGDAYITYLLSKLS